MNILQWLALITFIILLNIRIILFIIRKIRQYFMYKHCTHLCFKCEYRYECDVFLGRY